MRAAALMASILCCSSAAAEEQAIDRMERMFGPTRINAALGHGGLTVGVSHAGELTVLRWPNPSYFEHLNHETAKQAGARDLPLYGAQPNEGSFAGLLVHRGQTVRVSWLRDGGEWTRDQAYLSPLADTLRTRYRSDALGITVEQVDVVDPRCDVLARRYRVAPDTGAALDALALVYFENMAPNVEKDPFVPVGSYTLDAQRDYALVYDESHDALLHGSLPGRPQALLDGLSPGADAAAVAAFLTAVQGKEGAFFALGGSTSSSSYQCGLDAVDSDASAGGPQDAFEDAADGALSGSRAATHHATGALAFDLAPTGGEVTVLIAAAETAAAALATLGQARQVGFDDIRGASEQAWAAWLADARLPATDDADRLRIARRCLITIRTATAAETGAVVASIASQPAYALDWPRDGAFINLALDAAGKHAAVTRHNRAYAAWQRERDGQDVFGSGQAPAGSFAMNYYTDGTPGGLIPFEIDQVGLVLWTLYTHATFLSDDAERVDHLRSVWPAVQRSADLLATCKDEATGLQCAANEDDDVEQTISLHGAVPTVLGLRSAVRTARYLGHQDRADGWLARLRELEQAVEQVIRVEGSGYTGIVPGQRSELWPPWRRTGALAWAVWPGELRPHDTPAMRQTAAEVRRRLEPFFTGDSEGGAYFAKGTLALAMHAAARGASARADLELVRRWLDVLVKQVPTPGTDHYGETCLHDDLDGDGVREYENRVSIPHVWEASLVYLSLMAAYSPELLQPDHLAGLEPPGGGCSAGRGRAGWPAGLLLLLVLLALTTPLRPNPAALLIGGSRGRTSDPVRR